MHSNEIDPKNRSLNCWAPSMALRQALGLSVLSILPGSSTAAPTLRSRTALFSHRLTQSLFGFPLAIPISIGINVPPILSGLWESILRAVPKKKTSHRKKRQRFMAGKALKDVKAINKCSACGKVKRAHLLCPYCVAGRKSPWLKVEIERLTDSTRDQKHVEGQEISSQERRG